MSLRLRLVLVTLSVVTVMAIVSLISSRIDRRIQDEVESLHRTHEVPLRPDSALGVSLSIEGTWDGSFLVPDEIEQLPSTRFPKLRGALEAVDLEQGWATMYGRTIRITDETEFEEGDGASLASGQRVEISCRVGQDGGWTARKVETSGIKKSDKVKGTITDVSSGPGSASTYSIHGLPVLVRGGDKVKSPRGPLYRLESAAQMGLALQECLTAANQLLKEGYRKREFVERGQETQAEHQVRVLENVEERFLDGFGGFRQYLTECRRAEEAEQEEWLTSEQSAARKQRLAQWIEPLEQRLALFERQVRELVSLAVRDLDEAQVFLEQSLEPFLRGEVLSRVNSYHFESQEAFSDELATISARTEDAARLELVTSAVGLVLALALGLFVSRSITRPILALKDAAREIGHGKLDTRVPVRSRDEIGVLATAFNRMAEELAQTTVSVANLQEVQEDLRRSLSEKELLLREVHHRVKNNLQVISSLLDLQASSTSDSRSLEGFQESQDRIRSMFLIHEQLYRAPDLEAIHMRSYLELLAGNLSRSHLERSERIGLRVEVEDLSLDLDRALSCGLIVNELVTNAFKHAFPEDARGEIRVLCRRAPAGRILLEVSDDGRGLEGAPGREAAHSLGMSLVEALTRQLRGRLERNGQSGASFRIEFPAAQPVEVA